MTTHSQDLGEGSRWENDSIIDDSGNRWRIMVDRRGRPAIACAIQSPMIQVKDTEALLKLRAERCGR